MNAIANTGMERQTLSVMLALYLSASWISLAEAADQTIPLRESNAASLTTNVALTSDYRFRGITQSNGRPAIQGGVDFERRGLYLGIWASSISWLADSGTGGISSSSEWDFYGGWKAQTGNVGWDIGLLYYAYPGQFPAALNEPDTLEASLSAQINRFSLTYSVALTDLFGFERSRGANYVSVSYQLPVVGFGIELHAGHQHLPAAPGRTRSACSYSDWRLSVTRPLGGFEWRLAWVDTTAKGDPGQCYVNSFNRDLGKRSIVLSVGITF